MLVIKELLFDGPREAYVAQRITRCPADVELHTVASWLSQRYGAPIDEARSVDPKVGELVVGWVYRVPSDWPDAEREGFPLEVWRLEHTEYEPTKSRGGQGA